MVKSYLVLVVVIIFELSIRFKHEELKRISLYLDKGGNIENLKGKTIIKSNSSIKMLEELL